MKKLLKKNKISPTKIAYTLITSSLIFCTHKSYALPLNVSSNTESKLTSQKIINGTAVANINSPFVRIKIKHGNDEGLCTGSIISSKAVLTAWHCVTNNPRSMSVVIGNKNISVKKVSIHPDVYEDTDSGLIRNDIAILHLSKSTKISPVNILVSKKAESAADVNILGYGLDQFGQTGVLNSGINKIESVFDSYITTLFDSSNESNTCNGDSGGPLLSIYKNSNGKNQTGIIGITSSGTDQNCDYGDITYFTNLQSDRILQYIKSEVPKVKIY